MNVLYFDCFGGISGDMTLAALLDCGVRPDDLRSRLNRLALTGYSLNVFAERRHGLRALRVEVAVEQEEQPHRHLKDILALIENSGLNDRVRQNAARIFTRLADAEAAVHGVSREEVHFHEVGALDSIIDIVGTCIALDLLDIEQIYCSPLPTGGGTVRCAHGVLPVPAPATLELMRGLPVRPSDIQGELVTPTGAAIVATLARAFGNVPDMHLTAAGYGFGRNDFGVPSFLRVMLGRAADKAAREPVLVLETDIDDMNPEFFPYIEEVLRAAGALDVFMQPVMMKKGRPGTRLSVLSPPGREDNLADVLLTHSSTLGVRLRREERWMLPRQILEVDTPLGKARVKMARLSDGSVRLTPEYEDCRRLAGASKHTLEQIYRIVYRAGEEAVQKLHN